MDRSLDHFLGPQESVYYYFGGPNKLFATWFQLEEPSRFAEKEQIFGNRLVVEIFFAEGKHGKIFFAFFCF